MREADHPRHKLDQIRPNSHVNKTNTIVLPGTDTAGDIAAIQRGEAHWNPTSQRYELPNGRSYGVESSGTVFPVSGPGLEVLGRAEYKAVKEFVRADGDVVAAGAAMARDPCSRRRCGSERSMSSGSTGATEDETCG